MPVIALLVKNDIKAQTHAGVRQMFGLHFVKTGLISKELGKFYTDIFDKRLTGDYDDFIDYSKEEIIELFEPAKEFVYTVGKLLSD